MKLNHSICKVILFYDLTNYSDWSFLPRFICIYVENYLNICFNAYQGCHIILNLIDVRNSQLAWNLGVSCITTENSSFHCGVVMTVASCLNKDLNTNDCELGIDKENHWQYWERYMYRSMLNIDEWYNLLDFIVKSGISP